MYSELSASFNFMARNEKIKLVLISVARIAVSALDLIALGLLGILATSTALYISNGSDPARQVSFLGFIVPSINFQMLPGYLSLILAIFVSKAAASLLLIKLLTNLTSDIEARAVTKILEFQFDFGRTNVRRKPEGITRSEIEYHVYQGAHAAFTETYSQLSTLAAEGVLFAGFLVLFALIDPVSTGFVILYLAITAFAIQALVGSKVQKATESVTADTIQAFNLIADLQETRKELWVSGKTNPYIRKITFLRKRMAKKIAHQIFLLGMPRYLIETSVLIGVALFAALKFATSDLTSAMTTTAVFLTGSLRIMAAMLPWQNALIGIKQALTKSALVSEAISSESPKLVTRVPNTKKFEIQLNSVSFKYLTAPDYSLKDISIKIKSGSQVAIIGESGSGKSTLADLIMGISTPSKGKVVIGGYSPLDWISSSPGSLSYVPQSPGIIHGTILDNIVAGEISESIDLDRVAEVIQMAHLERVLNKLPLGLDTNVGVAKNGLSGGELQRIGLARALYTRPKILIIDEATSALDAKSEFAIRETINNIRGQVTVLLIAHRLNTVTSADMVFYMQNGSIADRGTLQELIFRNPKIAEAVKLSRISKRNKN